MLSLPIPARGAEVPTLASGIVQPAAPAPELPTSAHIILSEDGTELLARSEPTGPVIMRIKLGERGRAVLRRGEAAYVQYAKGFSIVRLRGEGTVLSRVDLPWLREGWNWSLMGNYLTIENPDGRGATFRITDSLNPVYVTKDQVNAELVSLQEPTHTRGKGLLVAGAMLLPIGALLLVGGGALMRTTDNAMGGESGLIGQQLSGILMISAGGAVTLAGFGLLAGGLARQ